MGFGWLTNLIPLAGPIISAIAAKKAGDKAAQMARLDPATQAMQDEAMRMQQARMLLMQPLFERLSAGAGQRLPASYGGAPSIGQMRTPGAGAAMGALARGLPPPRGGRPMRARRDTV